MFGPPIGPKSCHNSPNKLSGERSLGGAKNILVSPTSSGIGRFHLIFIIISWEGENQCKINQVKSMNVGIGCRLVYAFFNRYRQFSKTFCFLSPTVFCLFFLYFFCWWEEQAAPFAFGFCKRSRCL